MAGGLLQLAVYGAQDLYLTGEAKTKISFFKSVYRKYTNFSMESKRLEIDSALLTENFDVTDKKCTIPRNGDLLSEIFFCFELPNIYSGKYSSTGNAPFYNYEFQWIKNIGTNIIDEVSINIGGNKIDKLYGEWMNIWAELHMDSNQKTNFDNMIGNIPELYDPKNSPGQNGVYPNITSGTEYKTQADKYSNTYNIIDINDVNTEITLPSIRKRTLKVPLLFWFGRNKGLALPLIALQYSKVELSFKFKSATKLFTIIETDSTKTFHKKRIVPNTDNHNSLANFIKDSSMVSNTINNGVNVRNLNFLDIKPYVEANYIFLDRDERNRFAKDEHEYLIDQVVRNDFKGVTATKKHTLRFNHPVKYLCWVGKRSDISERNDWNNYTNWIYPNIAPYSKSYKYQQMFGSKTTSNNPFYTVNDSDQELNFNSEYLEKNILKKVALHFNGQFRINSKEADFFSNAQTFQYFNKKKVEDGIYVYSFSIDPNKFQPSGSCNFSRIDNVEITLDINTLPKNSNGTEYYKYDFDVYSVNYNQLRIISGEGKVGYQN